MEGNTHAPNETKIAAAFHQGDAFLYFLMNYKNAKQTNVKFKYLYAIKKPNKQNAVGLCLKISIEQVEVELGLEMPQESLQDLLDQQARPPYLNFVALQQ